MPGRPRPGSPVAVRYADDVVVLCGSQQQAEQVKARLAEWLAPRGLAFNEDKTRIVRLSEGFDFLGFNVRRYPNRKLLIKPSKAAVRRLRERLAAETRSAARRQRDGGHRRAHPRHPGLGGLLPDAWCRRGRSPPWTTTCGNSPTSGPHGATRTSRNTGSSAGTSASSASSGTTTGCSATATAALTWSNSPGPASNGTCRSRAGHPRMTPPWPATGPNGGGGSNPRWTGTPCACSPGRTGFARSAGNRC